MSRKSKKTRSLASNDSHKELLLIFNSFLASAKARSYLIRTAAQQAIYGWNYPGFYQETNQNQL